MDRIIINVIDKKASFQKRIVIEVSATLPQCDFLTIGEEIMFDRDTDFITFGYDLATGVRQMAIVAGEGHGKSAEDLVGEIRKSLHRERFEIVGEDEVQVWLREKAPSAGAQ
ncbi:MAG TPA: hypothetical protein VK436_12170 [Methanocella sp.]|nr:hypothetical protein [Methanocella sp.]